jgi:hypothetical protein
LRAEHGNLCLREREPGVHDGDADPTLSGGGRAAVSEAENLAQPFVAAISPKRPGHRGEFLNVHVSPQELVKGSDRLIAREPASAVECGAGRGCEAYIGFLHYVFGRHFDAVGGDRGRLRWSLGGSGSDEFDVPVELVHSRR